MILILLANAFDAVLERSEPRDKDFQPKVRVSTRRTDGFVRISVEDNGYGISEEIKPKIFEPFFTTKPTGFHTGLSLSLCFEIVTQGFGGTITTETEEGDGALFTIGLPVS